MTHHIEPSRLKELLRCNPETGELVWLPRPREMFPCSRTCKTWNTRFAGKPALAAIDGNGYAGGYLLNVRVKAHRVIWALIHGEWPDQIDHIDGDKINNRISNLRNVSGAQNARNQAQHQNSTHYAMGIDKGGNRKKFRARKAGRYLGSFSTKEAAMAAIKQAEADLGFHPNHGREIRRPA